jgi:hypothetical protein
MILRALPMWSDFFCEERHIRRRSNIERSNMKKLRIVAVAIGLGLITSATQALAQGPVFHVGSDTRAMSQANCMSQAKFAIGETGLSTSFTDGLHTAGQGTDVGVLVTCLTLGARTFIEVVGSSLNSSRAEEIRNRVRTIVMGPPS